MFLSGLYILDLPSLSQGGQIVTCTLTYLNILKLKSEIQNPIEKNTEQNVQQSVCSIQNNTIHTTSLVSFLHIVPLINQYVLSAALQSCGAIEWITGAKNGLQKENGEPFAFWLASFFQSGGIPSCKTHLST